MCYWRGYRQRGYHEAGKRDLGVRNSRPEDGISSREEKDKLQSTSWPQNLYESILAETPLWKSGRTLVCERIPCVAGPRNLAVSLYEARGVVFRESAETFHECPVRGSTPARCTPAAARLTRLAAALPPSLGTASVSENYAQQAVTEDDTTSRVR